MSKPTTATAVAIADIVVEPDRMRGLRHDKLAGFEESMQARGLLQPIVLRTGKESGYTLVIGWHRLEAAKKLGWTSIPAIIHEEMEADAAELAEIDENLIRVDLTPALRARHVQRRKELYERQHPETTRGGDRRSKSKPGTLKKAAAFIDDTAAKTGRSRSAVAQEAARGAAIPDVATLAGTSLDKGDELDALAKLPAAEQHKLAERAKAGEKVSAKGQQPARKPPQRQPKGRAMLHRRSKLGDELVDKIRGTSLDRAEEMNELVVLNRGAAPGEHTDCVKQLVADAVAGLPVSACAYSAEIHLPPDIGPSSTSEVARLNARIEELEREVVRLERRGADDGGDGGEGLGALLRAWDAAPAHVRDKFCARVGLVVGIPPFLDRAPSGVRP